ncbi:MULTISPECIES: adenosine deaminase [unclassified Legionella]|uniref:adenosine deaminase family protein n=1 Tax=unclassified Legionella TaxID=2622702 RepID=UPI001054172D|nr:MULTISPECIES: adenosine deaminase [unclassified Legionella]MDI9819251.1 adenosine deaminase [Legionella sp. PL877]
MRFLKFCTLLLWLAGCQSTAFADINDHFNTIKQDPNALYAFLKSMPKSGELHYHLAGGAYPETMLALAAKGNYCLNQNTFVISKIIEQCSGLNTKELTAHPALYSQAIRAWSMKNFVAGKESGHDHFFNSFGKFMPIVINYSPQLLTEIIERAANQNEQYLEIMILPDNANSTSFAPAKFSLAHLAEAKQQLLSNQAFQENIKYTVSETEQLLRQTRQELGCFQNPQQDVCQLTVKFQYYVLREQPLENVFAQALNGFAAAAVSNDLVAVNLVQPEDGITSLADYRKQMEIFSFLHQAYPDVHIALHAGELSPEEVKPADLRFHITEAVNKAHAERIGHGTAIAFENKAEELLQHMASKPVAVEINLTSNRKILNVYGKKHPLRYYIAHKVPVVLSTDDEGILRTDLTREYAEAVLIHGINYPELKMINRNALTYSFMPGHSLWEDALTAKPVHACQQLDSSSCREFIKTNEKARLQWRLENKLRQFEKGFSQRH